MKTSLFDIMRTEYRPYYRTIGVTVMLISVIFLGTRDACAYTLDDVKAASNNESTLLKIARDSNTLEEVRAQALRALPVKTALPLLSQTWNAESYSVSEYFTLAFFLPSLSVEQKQRLALVNTLAVSPSSVFGAQKAIIDSLAQNGKIEEALAESRRLYGLLSVFSPESPTDLKTAVDLVGNLLKAKALKDGKPMNEAMLAETIYKESVNKGAASEHPFAKLPFPTTPPIVAIFEKNADPSLRCMALLYQGKFAEASQLAEERIIAATVDEEPKWIDFKARAINGKASNPSAADTFLRDLA